MRRGVQIIISALLALVVVAWAQVTPMAGASTNTRPHASSTVWLCKPGVRPDPCAGNISFTSVPATSPPQFVPAHANSSAPIDCFYVYPTTSPEGTPNADLRIQSEEIGDAREQAAPFSQVCKVWAPMYRQMTVPCLTSFDSGSTPCSKTRPRQAIRTLNIAYASLARGFAAYLASVPKTRDFVLMGHSQGAAMLIRLIRSVIDPNPSLRHRLVSALLYGGNLTVPKGKVVGGAFKHVPLCTSASQLGCAIAYSSFLTTPPKNTYYGVPAQGIVSLMWLNLIRRPGTTVACVAPNELLGTSWANPRFLGGPTSAPYVTYPTLYKARCEDENGANVLHITVAPPPPGATSRPVVTQTLGPAWGLHLWDPNMTMGDAIFIVAKESARIAAARS